MFKDSWRRLLHHIRLKCEEWGLSIDILLAKGKGSAVFAEKYVGEMSAVTFMQDCSSVCVHKAASWAVECSGCSNAAILGAFSQHACHQHSTRGSAISRGIQIPGFSTVL